jgi:uncharacterized membrane protein (UPF0182 family)
MKIILFLSHCCALNNEQWSFRVFYLFTRWDWFRSSIRFRSYFSTCLRFSVELFLFVIFFTFFFVFVQLYFIYRSSFRSLRNHYLTLSLFIDDHDAMIVKWSSTKKKKLLKKEALIKLCCVVCVSLNRKESKNRENSESCDRISI